MADGVRNVVVLGSTGSIGGSTLDVIARHPDRYRVLALTAGRRTDILFRQCLEHRPQCVAMADEAAARDLRQRLRGVGLDCRVLAGPAGLVEVASLPEAHTVMAAIVGGAGLAPTLAAVRAGRCVLLANKEALVMAGPLFMQAVTDSGATLLPIDSEHNAVFQCMPGGFQSGSAGRGVRRILLTASGGPFRTMPPEHFADITPEQAVAHPNWVMGRKISVDSATMMNKGLEVIEAHWLFSMPAECIDVVVHPQSVIHSMVEYEDGSVLAQLGNPDMRTPIAHALAYPDRVDAGVERLDLARIGTLSFEPPDFARFPCLRLAYRALERGGASAVALNAANECAVERFLAGRVPFQRIAEVVEAVMDRAGGDTLGSLEAVAAADTEARAAAHDLLGPG
jgi:1-deoxy-D-xylulose-5-phosphate reductoisomerase